MRVVVLTQWYPPEPAALIHEFAESLLAARHDVTVLTGFPNYPSGRLYPGYKLRVWQRHRVGGVPVVRLVLFPDHSRSGLRRAFNYLSFACSCVLLGPFLVSRPDVVFVYHPPLTVAVPAVWLSRIWRVPFVLQVQDLWPDSLAATGAVQSSLLLGALARFATWAYARASAICVISRGFRTSLLARGVADEKIHVISNWVDTSTYRPQPSDPILSQRLGLAGRFNVLFAGNLGEAQGLEAVIEAAARLRELDEIQFVLAGDGVALARLKQMTERLALQNVRFLGRFPTDEMPAVYACAQVLLLHLRDEPLFRITIPHKTFAYMASGKPILAAIAGEAAELVRDARAGLTCRPGDPDALAAAVRRFYTMSDAERHELARNGLDAVRERYVRETLVGRLEAVLRRVSERS